MNEDLLQAVLETTTNGELPFNGEMVVDHADNQGETVTLDEADIMEDVLIEAFEARLAKAVSECDSPSEHVDALRVVDEALAEGDYEMAVEQGCRLLQAFGVDEAEILEFKKGFKVSAGVRNRMSRVRRKPKTGAAKVALRHRRRAARKGSARMKRARYYKQNRRRIARRRSQLQNAITLDANTVVEMVSQGMRFLVAVPGSEPIWSSTRAIAEALAGDAEGAEIVELSAAQIAEARSKSTFAFKKKDDDEDEEESDDDEDDTDESENAADEETVDECGDDMDDEPSDDDEDDDSDDDAEDDDSEDDSEDDDEDDSEDEDDKPKGKFGKKKESVDEDQAAQLANEVAKYMIAHPDVGYGELGTRFKLTRPVAQHLVVTAGRVAGSESAGSWLLLAKELMKSIRFHTNSDAIPSRAPSLPRKNHRVNVAISASVEDDGANLAEEDDEVGEGVVKHKKVKLPKARLKGKEGAIRSAHANIESEETDDAEDVVDEESTDETVDNDPHAIQTHSMGKGKAKPPKSGPTKLKKPKSPVRGESADETEEVTVPMDRSESLIAAAAANGLDSNATRIEVDSTKRTVTMFVTPEHAEAIREALAG